MRATLIVGLLLAAPAHAINTVQELLNVCNEGERGNTFKAGECLGYIDGALSAQVTRRASDLWSGAKMVRTSCPINDPTFGQIKAIFIKYANDNPAMWTYPADVHIEMAMAKAFPCPK